MLFPVVERSKVRSLSHAMLDELRRQWRDGRKAWNDLWEFNALPRQARRVVFYSETAADWAHIGPVAAALEQCGERVIRVTSDMGDPVLAGEDAFFVGSGSARTILFRTIEADAFVMTLSDLGSFHLKRSGYPVHYLYVFHSIASTHRVYREHAFDAYDTIFCVGPHHLNEIRRTESVYGLKPKRLVEQGYCRLDTLLANLASKDVEASLAGRPNVLIAPSWGESSIVRHCLEPLIEVLLAAGFDVSLRLHPMTSRKEPRLAESLVRKHGPSGRFRYDPHINTTEALLAADTMISEWSGAPLEYAFARERPVIFIDTPPKIHNASHARIEAPFLEADIREEIGRLISLRDIHTVPDTIRLLLAEPDAWRERIRAARERSVFNIGRSGDVAARHILGTLPEKRSGDA